MEKQAEQSRDSKLLFEPIEEQLVHMQPSGTESIIKEEKKQEEIEEPHAMKLIIDVHSIKGLSSTAKLSVSYFLPILNEENFSSGDPIQYQKNVETAIPNGFKIYEFISAKSDLYGQLSTNQLKIQIWEFKEEYKSKPILFGVCHVLLGELIGNKAVLQKTPNSAVRVYNAELSIIEDNPNNVEQNVLGKLQCVFYLEDFGPAKVPESSLQMQYPKLKVSQLKI